MTRLVVDTSVLAAISFGEPDAERWSRRLEGSTLYAPKLLQYELQSVAWRKCRAHPSRAAQIVAALSRTLEPANGITWIDPEPAEVVLTATATGLTAYHASYLCLARALGADLVTADRALSSALDPYAD